LENVLWLQLVTQCGEATKAPPSFHWLHCNLSRKKHNNNIVVPAALWCFIRFETAKFQSPAFRLDNLIHSNILTYKISSMMRNFDLKL